MVRPSEVAPPVIVLFGATGVGKSDALFALPDRRFEIISADSMQAYRHMDIGTAKPSPEALGRLPHHLISVVDPDKQFNAGEFVKRAEALIHEIRARGGVPVVSGGTGFYIRSLLFGLPESPPGREEVREKLRVFEREHGSQTLYEELKASDPVAADRIPPNDRYRVARALEVMMVTGKSVYSFRWPQALRGEYDFLILGLERPRDELYWRIEQRVGRMFERGLAGEVRSLLAMGYGPRDPGMRAIGYREFFQMQRGCMTFPEVRDAITRDTRRYAKRQMTYFRSLPAVRWMDAGDAAGVLRAIDEFLCSRCV